MLQLMEPLMQRPMDPRDVQALAATCRAARCAASQGPLVLITDAHARPLYTHELNSLLTFLQHNGSAVRVLQLDQMPADLWPDRPMSGLPSPHPSILTRITRACPQLRALSLRHWEDVRLAEGHSDEGTFTSWGHGAEIVLPLAKLPMLEQVHVFWTKDKEMGFPVGPAAITCDAMPLLSGCPRLSHLGLRLWPGPAHTILSSTAASQLVQLHLIGLLKKDLGLLARATGLNNQTTRPALRMRWRALPYTDDAAPFFFRRRRPAPCPIHGPWSRGAR